MTPSNTLSNTLVGSNTPGDPPSRDNISGAHTPPPDDALGTPDYRYEIVDTGYGSHVLGPCEVCGKHASTIYHQIKRRVYTRPDGSAGLTHDGCRDIFGHEVCLVKMRRHDHRWQNLAEGLMGGEQPRSSHPSPHLGRCTRDNVPQGVRP